MPFLKRLLPTATIGTGVAGTAMILFTSFASSPPEARFAGTPSQAAPPCTGIGVTPVSISSALPLSFSPASDQKGADCMAWQGFIALNWKADPNRRGYPDASASQSSYGTPGDTSPKVWESYWDVKSVFGSTQGKRLLKAKAPRVRKLSQTSKLGSIELSMSDISQAGDRKWLTDQNGNLTYYEVLINEDEVDFITRNTFNGSDLTTFAGQAACAQSSGPNAKGGFNLPAGGGMKNQQLDVSCQGVPATYGQNVGAIELKAAWRILPSDHSLDSRYKTSVAQVSTPDGKVSQVTVGLVGLHIVRKVQGAPQFVWATFEHVDNCPDDSGPKTGSYSYFDPNCDPNTNPYGCVANKVPGEPCDANGQPTGCVPYSARMQITRLRPVDSIAQTVTAYVWSQLPSQSVFRNYRLINVQWPSLPSMISPGSRVPLSNGGITPSSSQGIVANCTMETYMQAKNSCMDCHQAAPIGQPSLRLQSHSKGKTLTKVLLKGKSATQPSYASNYSFVFANETKR